MYFQLALLRHESNGPRFFSIIPCVSKISSSSQKNMLININNFLPSIYFNLGRKKDDDKCVNMLVKNDVAMNTGNLNYHLGVMS